MPSSLVKELKILVDENHFKDLSEEIRSVVRDKCMQFSQPHIPEIQKLRDELQIKKQTDGRQQLIEDALKKVLEELKNGS